MVKFTPIRNIFEIEGFCSAFKFSWKENFIFSGERHNFWEIVYVKSGEVEITEDENIYTLRAGEVIIHAPMEFHRVKSSGGTSPTGYILSFSTAGELPAPLTEGVFMLDAVQIEEYERICSLAIGFVENSLDARLGQEASLSLSSFIMRLERELGTGSLSKTRSAEQYRLIVSFMGEHVTENLTVEDIANSLAVSVSYIKLLFKTYAGVSPKSYFNDLRLKKAFSLLESGSSVSEISYLMNFSSPSYFSSFCKKRVGEPPTRQKTKITRMSEYKK